MTQINAITGSVIQTAQVQSQQATERSKQIREAQEQTKGAFIRDEVDIPVENTEEAEAIDDGHSNPREKKRSPKQPGKEKTVPDEPEHIDLTA